MTASPTPTSSVAKPRLAMAAELRGEGATRDAIRRRPVGAGACRRRDAESLRGCAVKVWTDRRVLTNLRKLSTIGSRVAHPYLLPSRHHHRSCRVCSTW